MSDTYSFPARSYKGYSLSVELGELQYFQLAKERAGPERELGPALFYLEQF